MAEGSISTEQTLNLPPLKQRLKKIVSGFDVRLDWAANLANKLHLKGINAEVLNHIEELTPGEPVVFAMDSMSDINWTGAVQKLLPFRKIKIANLETNTKDPKQGIPIKAMEAGNEKIFVDIDNTFDIKKNVPNMEFNPDNLRNIEEEMGKGYDFLIPAYDRTVYGHLPARKRAGIGGGLLAHLKDVSIVPVALDIHSDEPIGRAIDIFGATLKRLATGKRPEATLKIGKPLELEKIPREELEDVLLLLTNRNAFNVRVINDEGKEEVRRDQERYQKAKANYDKLREQANTVMDAMADLLPLEKRGGWGTNKPGENSSEPPQVT